MKKASIITAIALFFALPMWGQNVIDALPYISSQVKGTARYSAMGGAFGALGGEITSIRQNPAGIGVYRTSEVSATASFNIYDNTVTSRSKINRNGDYYFTGDNMGVVGVINLKNGVLRNLNFGFAYNNVSSFDNRYRGEWNGIESSMSNTIAAATSAGNYIPSDLLITNSYNPYNTDRGIPWMSILAYNNNLITTKTNPNSTYDAIFHPGVSSGNAYIENHCVGNIEEYDFNISGNVLDKFYWGLTLNMTTITYKINSYHGEVLQNAFLIDNRDNNSTVTTVNGSMELQNVVNTTGNGMGVKLGLLYRPIDFLRIGVAVHTPTFYKMSDSYYANLTYQFKDSKGNTYKGDGKDRNNQTDLGHYSYNYISPWHYMASVACVLGKSAILSVDYEVTDTQGMYYSDIYSSFDGTNSDIADMTRCLHNVRVGAEYRITPLFSLRAGYAYESSPMDRIFYDGQETLISHSTMLNYLIPGEAHNISCGLGYRVNNIFVDAAYVYRTQNYRLFNYVYDCANYGTTDMLTNNHSLKITIGYRF